MLSNSQVWPQGLQHKSKHIKVNNTSNSFMTSMNEYCLTIWNIYTQTPQSRPCGHHELLMVMEKKLVCFFNCTFFQTPHSFYKMYLFAQSRIFALVKWRLYPFLYHKPPKFKPTSVNVSYTFTLVLLPIRSTQRRGLAYLQYQASSRLQLQKYFWFRPNLS